MKDINGQDLHNLKLELGLDLEVVKAASVQEIKDIESLESKHFANPLDKKFPTHTKEATERSVIYFFGDKESSNYPTVEAQERLYKAARFWGVSDHYYTVKNASESIVEAPVANVEYALNGKLPVSTEGQILKSAAALIDQQGLLSFVDRSEAALNVLKAACDLDITLNNPELEVMAGVLPKDRVKLASAIKTRGVSFERLGTGSEIYKAASEAVVDCTEDELDEICGLIDTFERSKNASKAMRGMPPIETCFFDEAPDETLIHLANGNDVLFSQVKEAALTPFYALGVTVPLEVTNESGELDREKTAAFLERIPKADCDLFEKTFNQCR